MRGLPLGQKMDGLRRKKHLCTMFVCHIRVSEVSKVCDGSCVFLLADPRFVGVHLIPESDNPEDDKIFLFFKENAMDGEHAGKATISRIGQLCKVTTHTNDTPVQSRK